MKQKSKCIFALLLVLSLSLFAGCGSKDRNDSMNGNDDRYQQDGEHRDDLGEDLKDMGDDLKDGIEDGMDRMRRSLENADDEWDPNDPLVPGKSSGDVIRR